MYELYPCENISSVYFNSTYINPENHISVRRKINETMKRYIPFVSVENHSQKKKKPKIAIVSKNWNANHAVQKCIGSFIEGMSDDFTLALIEISTGEMKNIPDYFKEIYRVKSNGTLVNYGSIVKNDFNAVIFPDVGLNTESLLLSNVRIAPVQIAMYGHPVTTASNEIDFFIAGELSETEEVHKHYTEKTVLVKGPGMNSVRPNVSRPNYKEKMASLSKDVINIYLSASTPKINPLLIKYWKKIIHQSTTPIKLHLLTGNVGMQELSVARYDLEQCIGNDHIKIHRHKKYINYMNVIKKCDIAIGSFHYGEYNRVVDALWMGTPIVVVKGTCGYQNTGAGTLKAVGLDELIAKDPDEYVEKTISLIDNNKMREHLQKKILSLDIQQQLVDNKEYIDDFKEKITMILSESKHQS